jgi:hypothetical protein
MVPGVGFELLETVLDYLERIAAFSEAGATAGTGRD